MILFDLLVQLRAAALRAVDPAVAVQRFFRDAGTASRPGARLYLVAAGKAAPAMAQAAGAALGAALVAGVVVTKYGHTAGYALPASVRVYEGGHPLPDRAGQRGAEALEALVRSLTPEEGLLALLSGGASALLPLPAPGISLPALQATTDLLLRAGAPIQDLNMVRKHLSRLKGGQLARLSRAPITALLLSDVVGDSLEVIASGPTAPDPTTYAEAWQVLARYGLLARVPRSVRAYLRAGMAGRRPETPKPGDACFARVQNHIVASNRQAAQAAVEEAARLGYRAALLTTALEGEAREAAQAIAAMARSVRLYGDPLPPPACLVWGGETTVTVRGGGRGGRNQELALAASVALAGLPDVALMALATDGSDGPTDAAGAWVDGDTAARARALGLDPQVALAENDSYPFLDAVGALLRTGPTGTNVNDLVVLLVA